MANRYNRAEQSVRKERFIKMWNEGVETEQICTVLGYANADSVYYTAYNLRREGFKLHARPKPKRADKAPRSFDDDDILLRSDSYQPAIIMDAKGKPIARMHPLTRARTPL
jgi:hypothetical protein